MADESERAIGERPRGHHLRHAADDLGAAPVVGEVDEQRPGAAGRELRELGGEAVEEALFEPGPELVLARLVTDGPGGARELPALPLGGADLGEAFLAEESDAQDSERPPSDRPGARQQAGRERMRDRIAGERGVIGESVPIDFAESPVADAETATGLGP